jgi:hypothetical protein
MMVRTQITLDAEAHRRAKRRAAELGISFAEYVRQAVDRDLGEPRPASDPSEIFGLFDSGGSAVAPAFSAAVDAGDRGHRRPTQVLAAGDTLLTTDHVLAESWLLPRARAGRDTAERFFGSIYRFGPRRERAFDLRR